MSDGLLPLSPASPGGQIEDVEDLVGAAATPVVRQRVQITGAVLAEIARVVDVDPVGAEYGLVVRVAGKVLATVPVTSNAVLSSIAGSAVSVLLLAANPLRRQAIVVNESTSVLYVSFAAVSSDVMYTYLLLPAATLELPQPIYTGDISGVWVSATGSARITELIT